MPADPDRDAAALDGLRQRVDVADGVEAAREAHRILGPHRAHQRQIFVGHATALCEGRGAHRLELLAQPAHAGTEDDATAGEDVDRRQRLRRNHRIAIGHDEHAGAEPHFRRGLREVGQERQWLEVILVGATGELAGRGVGIHRACRRGGQHDVIAHEHGGVAKRLGLGCDFEHDVGPGERPATGKRDSELHSGRHGRPRSRPLQSRASRGYGATGGPVSAIVEGPERR